MFREEVRVTLELVELGAAEGGAPPALDKPGIEKKEGGELLTPLFYSSTTSVPPSVLQFQLSPL